MKMFHVKHERREKKMSSSINNETHEKGDSTMEMPKVTVTDAVNILRTMAKHIMSVIVRTPYEEKEIRELAEDYMEIAKAVEDMEAANLKECAQIAQYEDELRKQGNNGMIELSAEEHGKITVDAEAVWSISELDEGRCWVALREWNGKCKNFVANEPYNAVKRKVKKAAMKG